MRVLALFAAAAAGPLEDGAAAYQRGDYATALQILRPSADQGDATAQNSIGWMYANGKGVPQDYAQALVWYRKAAEQGDVRAQFGLGLVYANGHGVPQDYVRAHMWFNIAAGAAAASTYSYDPHRPHRRLPRHLLDVRLCGRPSSGWPMLSAGHAEALRRYPLDVDWGREPE